MAKIAINKRVLNTDFDIQFDYISVIFYKNVLFAVLCDLECIINNLFATTGILCPFFRNLEIAKSFSEPGIEQHLVKSLSCHHFLMCICCQNVHSDLF